MAANNWEIIHECDDENGNPAQWCLEINHPTYGKYCWINDVGSGLTEKGFSVEVDCGEFVDLKYCKSLASAKRWVTMHLL